MKLKGVQHTWVSASSNGLLNSLLLDLFHDGVHVTASEDFDGVNFTRN